MRTGIGKLAILVAELLVVLLPGGVVGATEKDGSFAEWLLEAAWGLQMPGSESDSVWWFVLYPQGLLTVERMATITGCSDYPEGVMSRSDFDATLDTLSRVEPWMDEGQRPRLPEAWKGLSPRVRRRTAGYRCETGEYGQGYIYFVRSKPEGLSGLLTINTET